MSAVEVTAREELYEIADVLRQADEAEKQGKALKEEVRGPFLELITEIVRDEVSLARQTVTLEKERLERFDGDLEAWRDVEYPTWTIDAVNTQDGKTYQVSLVENEALTKFEFTYGGYKFGRTVSMVGASIDAEGLYDEIEETIGESKDTEEVLNALRLRECIGVKTVKTYSLDEKKLKKVLAENPDLMTLVQTYINPGTPQVRLMPIKKAKDEE